MADSDFKTVVGSVEFEPETRQVAGKEVLDVTIRSTSGSKIRATIWPNLKAYFDKIHKDDLVAFRGKGTKNTVDGNDGPITYNNLSVTSLRLLGTFDSGEQPERDNAQLTADDELPF